MHEKLFYVLGAMVFWIFSGIRISHEQNNTTFTLVPETLLCKLDFCRSQKSRVAKAYSFGYRGPRCIFIYVSSPVKQLRGDFRVGHVWQGSPEEVWNEVSEIAGVDKQGFDAYYEGREIAYALQVTDLWEYENPVDLDKLRNLFSNFSVPQSWRYVKPEEYRSFQNMKRQIKEEVFNG